MKIAIVAVAGVSSRFNQGEKEAVLKCIYTTTDEKKTLLYSILRKSQGFDKVVLVGGYQCESLQAYVEAHREEFSFPIELVYNEHYSDLGTGYTLKVGLDTCLKEMACSEITLIEGDLFFDEASFELVKASQKSVATYNHKVIYSNKAVIAYTNLQQRLKYVFSTSHGAVQIPEEFLAIYNSGQIWKFADMNITKKLMQEFSAEEWEGTNLRFVEAYFNEIKADEREMIPLEVWENCNTRDDYEQYANQM